MRRDTQKSKGRQVDLPTARGSEVQRKLLFYVHMCSPPLISPGGYPSILLMASIQLVVHVVENSPTLSHCCSGRHQRDICNYLERQKSEIMGRRISMTMTTRKCLRSQKGNACGCAAQAI